MQIGYMRVSSELDRQATDLQRDALLAASVDSRHLFEDHASGAKDDRPGLVKALAFVQTGDVLVVWKLDRLGRSLSHLLSIVNALKEKWVAFRSLTEGMDTTTASGELLFHVFGALADNAERGFMQNAEFERNLIRERTLAGLKAARARGRKGGRPRKLSPKDLKTVRAMLKSGDIPGRGRHFTETSSSVRNEERAMLSYVYFGTNSLERATRFFDATLAPLGMPRCITGDPEWDRISAGWGIYEKDGARELAFWIGKPFDQQAATIGNGSMAAFSARSWKAVDEFHATALANGGSCDGAPGLRLHYSADFYAAYVRDPDGNKIAAVCRGFTAPQ